MKTKFIFLPVLTALLLAAGCQKYDDSALLAQLESQEQRISALEMAVNALNAKDYVMEVSPIKENDKIVGYKIVFAQSGEITVMNGKDGYSVEVLDGEVIFTIDGGTTFSIPRYAADHFNVPTSVILLTDEISDVLKKDTIKLDIIVNPSDYPLTKDQVTFIMQNKIFTKFDTNYDEESQQTVETPFDKTAHCDYEVVDIIQSDQYEGAYSIAVAVGGEGNFFNDTNAYVLIAAPDHNDKPHYACSNTSCKIHVIPSIEEGLTLDCPQQSFYAMDDAFHAKDSLKAHYVMLWSNSYKSEADEYRVYERSKVGPISISDDSSLFATDALDDSKFKEQGILMLNPMTDSEFWINALDAYKKEGVYSAKIEDAALTVCRGREVKRLPFNYKSFFGVEANYNITLSCSELKNGERKYVQDIAADLAAAGDDETYSSVFKSSVADNIAEIGGRCVPSIDESSKSLKLEFYYFQPTETPVEVVCVKVRSLGSVQNEDGTFSVIPEVIRLINHKINVKVTLTE